MSSPIARAFIVLALLAGLAPVLRAQDSTASSAPAPGRNQRHVTLAIATRFIPRGEALRESDIARRDTVITWRWGTIAPDTMRVQAGWVTRRPIAAGEVLRSPAVTPPPVVTSGSTVSAVWQDGPVRLVLAGVATNTAALGAPVGVRIDRGRRLDGVAVAPNTVRLR